MAMWQDVDDVKHAQNAKTLSKTTNRVFKKIKKADKNLNDKVDLTKIMSKFTSNFSVHLYKSQKNLIIYKNCS